MTGRIPLLFLFLAAILGAACTSGVNGATAALTPSGSTRMSASASASASASPAVSPSDPRPPIVIQAPASGDQIVSPVTISGAARVTSGTVGIAVFDARGQELAATSARAICGARCHGLFSATLSFFTETRQRGTIDVFEPTADGTAPRLLVSIPVVLVPG